MVTGLLDTAVLVDLLRGHESARLWIAEQGAPGITSVVWLELIEGARDRADQRQIVKLLNDFEQVSIVASDFEWAIQQLIKFNLSHNIDAMDCLIAAASYRLGVPLYTPNLKHFSVLLGALAQNPY